MFVSGIAAATRRHDHVDLYATAQKKKPRSHREMRPGFVMRRSALFAAATLTALRSSG